MITEDYVSFEIAKLLKEKGFDSLCSTAYETRTSKHDVETIAINNWGKLNQIERPTLQMAMKWLREVHKLYVNVCPCVEGYYWTEKWHSYIENLEKRYPFGKFISTFDSYKEACEAAIKYCLENLI